MNWSRVAAFAIAGLVQAGHGFAADPPILFEENRGQAARDVAFLAQSSGFRIFLMRDGSAIAAGNGETVRMGLVGATSTASLGVNQLPAKSNYLIGADPAAWHTGIPNYQEVLYTHVYPGIDVAWHARGREIEHDFLVKPGADPRRIRLVIDGASPQLTPENDLIAGAIRLHRPQAYQGSRKIACRFQLRGGRVLFALGPYDRSRPLIIDPVLGFSTLLGGSGSNSARSVALDSAGNIYTAGLTTAADFPVSAGAFQTTHAGGNCGYRAPAPCPDIFVSKFANDGSTLLFSTFLGSAGSNSLTAMAVDAAGNVYLTGMPASSGFPMLTPLPGNPTQPLGYFVAKLSADGSSLLYSTMLPLSEPQAYIMGLAVDGAGAVYLTGSSSGGLPLVSAFQSAVSQPPVFKTIDHAAHWQGLTGGLPADLVDAVAIDPTNPQTLYLGMDHGLYKSTDSGVHWTALLQGTPPQAPYPGMLLSPSSLAIDVSHSQTVYLGTLINGIYKSIDSGATWTPAGAGASRFVRMIAIDPTNSTTLYAATDEGLYKSTDAAATWNPTALMLGPTDVYFYVHNVVIDPSAPATIYAGTPKGVMKSLDGGATFAAVNTGFAASTDVTTLLIDPANPHILYATTTISFAPYRTSDGGAHWTQGQWPPYQGYVVSWLIDPVVHSTIWAATSNGLMVSRDGGATWTAPPTDLPYYGVERLAADSTEAIYAVANNFNPDAFAMKLDPTGSKIIYSTYMGGTGPDAGQAIAVDKAGRAYIAGFTSSFDFPIVNAMQSRPLGLKDIFVAALDATGSQLLWSTYLGGANDDSPQAIALDPTGNVHVTGFTFSPDFPLRQPSQSRFPTSTSGATPFVLKLKGDGSGLIFSTYLGGSGDDFASSVAADAAGNTYVAGSATSKDFPVVNALQPALAGNRNGFVAAWNGQNGALQYSTYLGGSFSDTAHAVAADSAGNAYVAGSTTSQDFPRKYALQYEPAACPPMVTSCGIEDAFLAKISPQTGPVITLGGVVDAARYGPSVAPGEVVSIFGKALAIAPAVAGALPLPMQLSDAHVTVNGTAAPLIYVSPLQINAQIPYETATGMAQVEVVSGAGTAAFNVQVASVAPAIFSLNMLGSGPGAVEHGSTGQVVTDSSPAAAGEIISVFCTGLGAVDPPALTGAAAGASPTKTPVQASVGGLPAQVIYAGLAPGFAGLYQINLQVPAGTPPGPQALRVSAGGAMSNTVTVAVN